MIIIRTIWLRPLLKGNPLAYLPVAESGFEVKGVCIVYPEMIIGRLNVANELCYCQDVAVPPQRNASSAVQGDLRFLLTNRGFCLPGLMLTLVVDCRFERNALISLHFRDGAYTLWRSATFV